MSLFLEQTFSEMKFGNATTLLDSDKRSLNAASINKHIVICTLWSFNYKRRFPNLLIHLVLFESTGAYRWCIDSGFCSLFAAAVSILQENPNPLCDRGASLKHNLVIAGNSRWECRRLLAYMPPSRFSLTCFFPGKSHLGNIYIYNTLIAYVKRKNNPPDFSHIEYSPHHHWS